MFDLTIGVTTMQEVTVYQGEYTLTLPQPDGSQVQALLPGVAEVDARFLAMWLDGKSVETQRAYTADMARFYTLIGKPLPLVTLEDVQAFKNSMVDLKPTSRNRALATVKSALSFGVKMSPNYLQANVGILVKLPELEDTLAERIMSEQAVARMLALESNPRNHAILSLLYHAGLRAQELCSLQWRHVQPREESGQLAVFGKGKKTRFVLLDGETWQEVQRLRPSTATPETYVFLSRQARSRKGEKGRRMDESMIHRIVLQAARRANIEGNVSPHWMRHAHATHAQEHGAPIALVQSTLGHKSIETTARYSHVRPNASSSQYLKV